MLDEYNRIYYVMTPEAGRGRKIHLTDVQSRILAILIHHKNKLVRKNAIIKNIWGKIDVPMRVKTHLIQIHIRKLNQLLDGELKITQRNRIGWIIKT